MYYTDEPQSFAPKTEYLIKQVTSNIYKEAKVKIFNSLNNCLQDVFELTPAIDVITRFLYSKYLFIMR
jgi:hypothetical protein